MDSKQLRQAKDRGHLKLEGETRSSWTRTMPWKWRFHNRVMQSCTCTTVNRLVVSFRCKRSTNKHKKVACELLDLSNLAHGVQVVARLQKVFFVVVSTKIGCIMICFPTQEAVLCPNLRGLYGHGNLRNRVATTCQPAFNVIGTKAKIVS